MLRCPASSAAHQSVAVTYHVENGGRRASLITISAIGRCGVVGSTLTFGSIGYGFESEHHFVVALFNRSLTVGHFPAGYKEAFLTPILKKLGLDITDV